MSALSSRYFGPLTMLRLAVATVVIPAAALASTSAYAAQPGASLPKGITQVTSVEGITE